MFTYFQLLFTSLIFKPSGVCLHFQLFVYISNYLFTFSTFCLHSCKSSLKCQGMDYFYFFFDKISAFVTVWGVESSTFLQSYFGVQNLLKSGFIFRRVIIVFHKCNFSRSGDDWKLRIDRLIENSRLACTMLNMLITPISSLIHNGRL